MYNYHIEEFTLWADYGKVITSDNTSVKIEDWTILYKPIKQNEKSSKQSEAATDFISREGCKF